MRQPLAENQMTEAQKKNRKRNRNRKPPKGFSQRDPLDGRLECTCWCEADIFMVPVELIRRGETVQCGPGCRKRYNEKIEKEKKK